MKFKQEDIFFMVIICVIIGTFCYLFASPYNNDVDNLNVKENRYSNCIERQSKIEKLNYEEMKEVCGGYLQD